MVKSGVCLHSIAVKFRCVRVRCFRENELEKAMEAAVGGRGAAEVEYNPRAENDVQSSDELPAIKKLIT